MRRHRAVETSLPTFVVHSAGVPRDSSDPATRRRPEWVGMDLTNESYVIFIGTKNFLERYYRDARGWVKVSARGRTFRMTAEQVLNHVLPAVAGIKADVILRVEHHEGRQSPRARR